MCFRRVVWGHGPHVLYQDTTVVLRRLAAAFARALALKFYDIQFPSVFSRNGTVNSTSNFTTWNIHNKSALMMNSKISLYGQSGSLQPVAVSGPLEGLNVVFYTRGSSGSGRSMQNEELLLQRLVTEGARVAYCCDFATISIEQQLALAIHADVVSHNH